MTTPTVLNSSGTNDTLLSTELNSMASSSSTNVLGSEITPTSINYKEIELTLVCAAASNMTAQAIVSVWLLRATDGTNYEDGGTSVTPTRNPDAIFAMRAATAQRITKRAKHPPGKYKVLMQQQTGQTWSSSGNVLTGKPVTPTIPSV